MRWLDGITDWMGMSLSNIWEFVMDREAFRAVIHGVAKIRTRLSNLTELIDDLIWLPWWLNGKESTCNAGDTGLIPGKIP